MASYEILPALAEALPTIIIGAGVVGLLSLARAWMKAALRARRFAATVAHLREAKEPPIPPVLINQYRPASIEGSRLGAHLARCVERLQRAEAMLEAGDDQHAERDDTQDARHELRGVIRHLVGIQTEYAPSKSVTALRA